MNEQIHADNSRVEQQQRAIQHDNSAASTVEFFSQ
jgi:hypothetical protein